MVITFSVELLGSILVDLLDSISLFQLIEHETNRNNNQIEIDIFFIILLF